ncbi:MAG TPA: hypothetical protein VFT64_05810 [Rickettsiales bacterium]|nr:hypothetical protein [Rickettsiales bacterium]
MTEAAEKKQPVTIPFVENLNAPDIYADEAVGFLLANNTMRITLATAKLDHTQKPGSTQQSFVVTNRLVMPITAAENLHKLLGQMLENVKKASASAKSPDIKLQ